MISDPLHQLVLLATQPQAVQLQILLELVVGQSVERTLSGQTLHDELFEVQLSK
jgi:hypothetical protein